jgi:hypothetical protein
LSRKNQVSKCCIFRGKTRKNINLFLSFLRLPIEKRVDVELAVFQRLANDQFCNANHCIVISVSNFMKTIASFDSILLCINSIFSQGRGYPDIPTRRCEKSLPIS